MTPMNARKDIHICNKDMKISSISLVTREMQTKSPCEANAHSQG